LAFPQQPLNGLVHIPWRELEFALSDPLSSVLSQVQVFLAVEKEEIRKKTSNRKTFSANICERQTVDGLYYSFFGANDFKIGEGVSVEVVAGEHTIFGALWFSEKKDSFYVITEQEIHSSTVGIREADEYELILMQENALNFIVEAKSDFARRLNSVINGEESFKPIPVSAQSCCSDKLNVNQREAVDICTNLSAGDFFHIIHGPPGTGKTTIISEIVKILRSKGQKVLVTSHTNVAVDNVLEKLAAQGLTGITRLGNKTNVSEELKQLVPVRADETLALKSSQIVGATLSKVAMLIKLKKLSWDQPFFDYVIVDESSMATIPLTLIGVLCGQKFVLVGDHKQLPPIISALAAKNVSEQWESLFRILYDKYPAKHTLLNIQYRSNPLIMGFSSKCFYDETIQSASGCENKRLDIATGSKYSLINATGSDPLVCIDMSLSSNRHPTGWTEGSTSKSYFNQYETAVAASIWNDFLSMGVNPNDICIITPFKLQAQILRNAMKKICAQQGKAQQVNDWHLVGSTVHSFQGKEKEVVIFCFSWVPHYEGEKLPVLLRNFRELNVALTRASKKLILIGSHSLFNEYPYTALSSYCRENAQNIACPVIEDDNQFLKLANDCFGDRKKIQAEEFWEEKAAEKKEQPQHKIKDVDPQLGIVRYYIDRGLSIGQISEQKGIPIQKVRELKDRIEATRRTEYLQKNPQRNVTGKAEVRTYSINLFEPCTASRRKSEFTTKPHPYQVVAKNVEAKALAKQNSQKAKDRQYAIKIKRARSFILSHPESLDSIVAIETELPLETIKEQKKLMHDEGLLGDFKEKSQEEKPVSFSKRTLVTCQFCELKLPEAQLQKHIAQNHI
jgi:hypothetical protein